VFDNVPETFERPFITLAPHSSNSLETSLRSDVDVSRCHPTCSLPCKSFNLPGKDVVETYYLASATLLDPLTGAQLYDRIQNFFRAKFTPANTAISRFSIRSWRQVAITIGQYHIGNDFSKNHSLTKPTRRELPGYFLNWQPVNSLMVGGTQLLITHVKTSETHSLPAASLPPCLRPMASYLQPVQQQWSPFLRDTVSDFTITWTPKTCNDTRDPWPASSPESPLQLCDVCQIIGTCPVYNSGWIHNLIPRPLARPPGPIVFKARN
jgi:hypothetical protein